MIKTPPFVLYYDKGFLKWKDFGLFGSSGNRAINYVMEYLDMSYHEATDYYNKNITQQVEKLVKIKLKTKEVADKFIIYKRNCFEQYELDFWARFGISEDLLYAEDVYPVDTIFIDDFCVFKSAANDPAFFYDLGNTAWKVYRPFSKKFKWSSKNLVKVSCEGWASVTSADKTNHLIIASSTKDRLTLKAMGYNSINPLSESNIYPLLSLPLPYSHIYIIFDNDKTGRRYAKKLSTLTSWIEVELKSQFKDVAEMFEHDFNNLEMQLNGSITAGGKRHHNDII